MYTYNRLKKLSGLLKEDETEIGNKLAQAYKSGPEATVNYLNQNTGDADLKKVLQAPKEDGKEDDDNVAVGSISGQAMSFAPTQSEIDLMKSVSYPLGSAKTLLDAITSGPIATGIVADNEAKIIIDGHHRWSGAIGIGGDKAQINGTDFKLPGDDVAEKLAAAQILIVAKNQGGKVPAQEEPFKTNILGKDVKTIVNMIMSNINRQTDKGAPGALLNDEMIEDLLVGNDGKMVLDWLGKQYSDRIKQRFGKVSDEGMYTLRMAIAQKVAENLAKLPQPAQGSPERKFMPQFDPNAKPAGPKVGDVKDDAASGTFNIAPPFVKVKELRQHNMKKKQLQEAIEMLKMKRIAKIITEAEYQKRLRLLEDDEILGTTDVVPLSKVDRDTAKAAIMQSGGIPGQQDGDAKDDSVSSSTPTIPVKELKPAQTEIIKEKAFGMAIKFLGKGQWDGVDLEAIISSDNYIMDGHHRWAAVFLIDPNASLKVTQIELPGKALVTALNYVTAAKGTPGNPGKGNVAEFTGDKLALVIDKAMTEGIAGDYPVSVEEVKEAMGKVPGANGDAAKGKEIMMKNADALPKQIMPGAPARVDMPVILPKQVVPVASLLSKGSFDIKAPYSSAVKSKLKVDNVNKSIDNQLFEAVLKKSISEFTKTVHRK